MARPILVKKLIWILLWAAILSRMGSAQQVPAVEAVRVREFYRLANQIQDKIWSKWSQTPAPLLLVTNDGEFLTHLAPPPKDFKRVNDEFYWRPRTFSTHLLATFPAFGPPSVIVIGRPEDTAAKSSTLWLITVMHEHFHQLQDAQPGAYENVMKLGLSRGDQTGMWMLNYAFPYAKPEIGAGFAHLRDLLLSALSENDETKFGEEAQKYVAARKQFFAQLTDDDHKYLDFQLWKEGIARYTQVKSAEAAATYKPSPEYASLADYESFDHYAAHARQDTLDELRRADISSLRREVVYSWGAAEGFLLDRLKPNWRDEYFERPFSLDSYF